MYTVDLLVPEVVAQHIYFVRGHRVMLDADSATLTVLKHALWSKPSSATQGVSRWLSCFNCRTRNGQL